MTHLHTLIRESRVGTATRSGTPEQRIGSITRARLILLASLPITLFPLLIAATWLVAHAPDLCISGHCATVRPFALLTWQQEPQTLDIAGRLVRRVVVGEGYVYGWQGAWCWGVRASGCGDN